MKKLHLLLAIFAIQYSYANPTLPSLEELAKINAQKRVMSFPEAHKYLKDQKKNLGDGIKVAVIDSGVNTSHPDLKNNIKMFDAYNFVDNSALQYDRIGHGTHVASIILQSAPNIQIMPIRVLDDYGRGTNENMFKGIKYAIDHGAKIINLSLGGTGITSIEKSTLETIISMARAKNILVIAAAGNESSNNDVSPIYPSNVWSDNLLSICSVDKTYHLSLFSNFGDKRVHVCAYGENILAANFQYYSDNKLYIEESGTSMATPFVAGLAALILSNNPNLLPYQVRDIIMNTSTSFSFLTGTSLTGGVINALEAVKF